MWYTVQSGDSIYSIAQRFGITMQQLMTANQLTSNIINTGQRLFIPIEVSKVIIYTVQPGDSLYKIARKYNTLIESISVLNRLQSINLQVGQRLVIPQYTEAVVTAARANIRSGPGTNYRILQSVVSTTRLPVVETTRDWLKVSLHNGNTGWISRNLINYRTYGGSKPILEIVGFYTLQEGPALPGSYRSFVDNTALISELPLFMYRFDQADPTSIAKFGEFTDNEVEMLVSIAHRNNTMILPVIHNLLYEEGGREASRIVVSKMVATPSSRAAAIRNIIALIDRFGFDGVNIDIEDVYMADSGRLSQFYTELGRAMKNRGYFLSASVPSRIRDYPPFNPFSDPFDYAAIGAAVDQFIVMLYNEHGWPGSGPGPVVSSGWMTKVLGYTLTKMPASKVVAAISVFGFDFNLTTERNTYVTYAMAADLARRYNRSIIFDQDTLTPMFSYTDEQGNQHEVWFENSDSIIAKMSLAWRQGISGVALWRLGMEDPGVWPRISSEIVVKRAIW
ncbi:MAG: LysM peptidoglycan-binding domain-containing protein [Clostridiaceae bacterium]